MPKKIINSDDLHAFYLKILPFLGKGSSSEGGGGHKIEDDAGTELTQRDTLQFGDGFSTSDDSTNEKTVVEPKVMSASDMDDVVTPLPSIKSGYHKYSTTEQVVGEWVDGSKIYEKVISGTVTTGDNFINMGVSVDKIILLDGYLYSSSGAYIPIGGLYYLSDLKCISMCLNNNNHSTHPNELMIRLSQEAWANSDCVIKVQYTKVTS